MERKSFSQIRRLRARRGPWSMLFIQELNRCRYRSTEPAIQRLHDLQYNKGKRILVDLKAIPQIDVDRVLEVVHQTGILPLGQPGRVAHHFLHNPEHHFSGKAKDRFHKPLIFAPSPGEDARFRQAWLDSFHKP